MSDRNKLLIKLKYDTQVSSNYNITRNQGEIINTSNLMNTLDSRKRLSIID